MAEKILLVDDDELMCAMTQAVLEKAGYLIEIAEDGLIAWEKINQNPTGFDLMVLDKKMPNLDGLALLRRIKSDSRFNNLPIVLLTGDTEQQDIVEGLAQGAYYYLTKPATEAVIKQVISNTLEEFRQKRELHELIGHQTNALRILQRAEFSFKTLSEAKELALWLADASMNPGRTVNGYSELLVNAVEHGNLSITYAEKSQLLSAGSWVEEIESRLKNPLYSDRQVYVVIEKTNTSCIVTITDQGNGFDWQNYLEFSPERVFDLHGRGIAMSKIMSFDSLVYIGNGNTVIATVHLPAHG